MKDGLKLSLKIMLLILLFVGFIVWNHVLDYKQERQTILIEDDPSTYYQIDNVRVEGKNLIVDGWFFEAEKYRNVKREKKIFVNPVLAMRKLTEESEVEIDNNKLYAIEPLKMEWFERSDINEYYKCEYDYSACGFTASINIAKLDIEDGIYQFIFKTNVGDEQKAMATYFYYCNGELLYTNPYKRMKLEVAGTDLEAVIKEGTELVNRSDYDICIYQYDGKMYWIAGKDFYFEDDGSTNMQFLMDTTQFDKLPEARTSNGRFWSDITASFEKYEITSELDCGKYRVCVREIPTDYSVGRISLGYYASDGWIWRNNVRPRL